jgi:hypothetical protein
MIKGYNSIVLRFHYSDRLLSLLVARTAIIATLYSLEKPYL